MSYPIEFSAALTAAMSIAALVAYHRTVLCGFSVIAAIHLWMIGLLALTIASLCGLSTRWISDGQIVVFRYMSIGVVLYVIGVHISWITRARHVQKLIANNPLRQHPQLITLFISIALIATVLDVALPHIPTISGALNAFTQWFKLALLAAIVYSHQTKKRKQMLILFCIFFPLGLINVIRSGHAGLIGTFMLHIGLVWLFFRRPSFVKALAFLALLYAYLVFAGVWLETRTLIREGRLEGSLANKAVGFMYQFAGRIDSDAIPSKKLLHTIRIRLDGSHLLGKQVEYMPRKEPFAYGKTLWTEALPALVPRLVWKYKPISAGGAENLNRYTGMRYDSQNVSVDLPLPFELFANFGVPGVLFGLFVFGYFMGTLEIGLFKKRKRLDRFLMSIALLSYCSDGGGRLSVMIMSVGLIVVSTYSVSKFLEFSHLFQRVLVVRRALFRTNSQKVKRSPKRTF